MAYFACLSSIITFVETDASAVEWLLEGDPRELDCDTVEEEGDMGISIGLVVMFTSGVDFGSKFCRNFSRPTSAAEGCRKWSTWLFICVLAGFALTTSSRHSWGACATPLMSFGYSNNRLNNDDHSPVVRCCNRRETLWGSWQSQFQPSLRAVCRLCACLLMHPNIFAKAVSLLADFILSSLSVESSSSRSFRLCFSRVSMVIVPRLLKLCRILFSW